MSGFDLPWVEKYRPASLKDVVGNKGNGPPGCGKTASILCLTRQLLGPSYKEAVLELNASNDRGIDVVRNKVKMFAQKKVTLPPGRQKFIILDEADSMTEGAQQALRRTMEIYSRTTRFALACNDSSKIIEPIQSRCAVLRFTRLSEEEIMARLLQIVKLENIQYTEEGLEAVVFTAEGDMRQALNNLQSTHQGFGMVSSENVFKVCDEPHPMLVKKLIDHCVLGQLHDAHKILSHLWHLGYSAEDIFSILFRILKTHPMEEYLKLEFIKEVGLIHLRVAEGLGTFVQLGGMLARLCRISLPPT